MCGKNCESPISEPNLASNNRRCLPACFLHYCDPGKSVFLEELPQCFAVEAKLNSGSVH